MQRDNAARHALERDASKTDLAQHLRECLRGLKAADRLDEIPVALRISGHRAPERLDQVERIKIIEAIEARNIHRGEFQAEKVPAGAQHTIGFPQRAFDATDVANAERDRYGVEAASRKRQSFGVAGDESNVSAALWRARLSKLNHFRID